MIIDQQTDTTGKILSSARLRYILSNAFSFEWSKPGNKQFKDPQNLLTPACFWALTNSQYEPFTKYLFTNNQEALEESKQNFEFESLQRHSENQIQQEQDVIMTTESQLNVQEVAECIKFEQKVQANLVLLQQQFLGFVNTSKNQTQLDAIIESLSKDLEETSVANTIELDQIFNELAKETQNIESKRNIELGIDFAQLLKKKGLLADTKHCTTKDQEYFQKNDWAVQNSMISLMIHENENVNTNNQSLIQAKKVSFKLQDILESEKASAVLDSKHRDEDCCLICGDADYQEDNALGYCELCQLSTHYKCYGLPQLDQNAPFLCLTCHTFGDFGKIPSMMVQCILCKQVGGALMPVNIDQTIEDVEMKDLFQTNADDYLPKESEVSFKTINQLCQEEKSQWNSKYQTCETTREQFQNQELLEEKKEKQPPLYADQLRKLQKAGTKNTLTRGAWAHHSCFYWLSNKTPSTYNAFRDEPPKVSQELLNTANEENCYVCHSSKPEIFSQPDAPGIVSCKLKCAGARQGHPLIRDLEKVFGIQIEVDYKVGSQADCDTHFHVECARRAGYNLAFGHEEIYCESHRNLFRKQTVQMLYKAKEKEIIDFAFNLEDCLKQDEKNKQNQLLAIAQERLDKIAWEKSFLLQAKARAKSQIGGKFYLGQTNGDDIALIRYITSHIAEKFDQQKLTLQLLRQQVELIAEGCSYKNLNEKQAFGTYVEWLTEFKFQKLLKVLVQSGDEGQSCSDQDIRNILEASEDPCAEYISPPIGEHAILLLSKEETERVDKFYQTLYDRWNAKH